MRNTIRQSLYAFYYALDRAGYFRARAARGRGVIVTYHNVLPDALFDGALHLGVSHRESVFRRQIGEIAKRYEIVTDILGLRAGQCAITFDDGYKNNRLAAAILEEEGARGVFFVPASPLADGKTLEIDRVLKWFSYAPPGHYAIPGGIIALGDAEREEAYAAFYARMLISEALWEMAPSLLEDCYSFARLGGNAAMEEMRFTPMSEADLTDLKRRGHAVGCHSWNHRALSVLSEESARVDFEKCEPWRPLFNTDVYSYPFGGKAEIDEKAIRLAKAFGYAGAVTNIVGFGGGGLFTLPRISLPQSDVPPHALAAKLCGFEARLRAMTGRGA